MKQETVPVPAVPAVPAFKDFMAQIRSEVLNVMESKAITLVELADKMNTSPDLVEQFLNRGFFVNLLTLYDYAKALGCEPRFVLDDPQKRLPL